MKPLKWGLIGCGDIANKKVVPALNNSDICELVSINRAQTHLLEQFANRFNISSWHKTWQELISDPNIEAVYIATPVYLHKEMTILSAKSGKHILCEKPMAINSNECDEMIKTCKDNNVKLAIAYYRHFYPIINKIKEIIKSGEIGQITLAQINAFEWFDRKEGEPRYWLLEKNKSGGGPLKDFGCHRIEVFLNLFGPIKKITSKIENIYFNREVEDTAFCWFEHENKIRSILTITHAASGKRDTFDIYGTKGNINIPVLNEGIIEIETEEGKRKEKIEVFPNAHQVLIEDFVMSVRNNISPKVTGEIGYAVDKITDQIYKKTY